MSFNLPALPYGYSDLEPFIDARTMEIHHTKHHNAYLTNLNNAIAGTELENASIEEILKNLDMENKPLRNNVGGFYNHNLFWEILTPKKNTQPSQELKTAIESAFGSFDGFKEVFSKAAATQFGSGWAWLCVGSNGNLEVCATPNQDNPLMPNGKGCRPILGLDVWEHAYYLNYQNRRPDYIEAFFNIINWEKVSELYKAIKN